MGNTCKVCEPYIEKASEVDFVKQGINYAKQGLDYAKEKIPVLNDLITASIGNNQQQEELGKVGEYPGAQDGPNIAMDDFQQGQFESGEGRFGGEFQQQDNNLFE